MNEIHQKTENASNIQHPISIAMKCLNCWNRTSQRSLFFFVFLSDLTRTKISENNEFACRMSLNKFASWWINGHYLFFFFGSKFSGWKTNTDLGTKISSSDWELQSGRDRTEISLVAIARFVFHSNMDWLQNSIQWRSAYDQQTTTDGQIN